MPDRMAGIGELYGGPDLINAARLSVLEPSLRDRCAGLLNGLGVVTDRIWRRSQGNADTALELVVASGRIRGTSSPATIAYAGRGENRDWCFDISIGEIEHHRITRYSTERDAIEALQNSIAEFDIAFIDGIDNRSVERLPTQFVRIPAWIKQRVRIIGNWPVQVTSLRRSTRQEVSRLLRKYEYTCRITRESADISDFYDQQYRPYISSVYGNAAIIVDRNLFFRECRRGALIQLISDGIIVATALLRAIGQTLAIVWTGMDKMPRAKCIPGGTDTLDYYSLLYAHLMGYKWLDFGPSRADLFDGTLQYKSKWGSEVTAGYFKQPSIYWTCTGRGNSAEAFLSEHAFVTNRRGTLTALCFPELADGTEALRSDMRRLSMPGIAEYRAISLSAVPDCDRMELRKTYPRVSILEAESVEEAISLCR